MSTQYRKRELNDGVERKTDSGVISSIPPDTQNRDWAQYQKWIEQGNAPADHDEEFE